MGMTLLFVILRDILCMTDTDGITFIANWMLIVLWVSWYNLHDYSLLSNLYI